jgi:hypothetical protein
VEDFAHQPTLDSLRSELSQLVRQKADLEKRITALRMSVAGLLRLKDATFDEDEPIYDLSAEGVFQQAAQALPDLEAALFPPPKLTDSIRSVLKSSLQPLTAGDVRRELEIMGFDFSKYTSNPLSSIHTILKRLADSGKAEAGKNTEGRAVYSRPKNPDRY